MELRTPSNVQEPRLPVGNPAMGVGAISAASASLSLSGPMTVDVIGVEEHFLACMNQVETPEFKAWFGDSRIVDEEGKPLVVHHGTDQDFDTFQNRGGKVQVLFSCVEVERQGFFFSGDPEVARSFGDNVMPVFLKAENPADLRYNHGAWKTGEYDRVFNALRDEAGFDAAAIPGSHVWELFDDEHGKAFVSALQKLGYDGVIMDEPAVEGERGWSTTYVVFSPTQIKSAARNCGAFDPTNPGICR